MVLFAKYYIYVTKCANEMPKVKGFVNYCKNVQNLEEIIARENLKTEAHKKKWKVLEN